MGSRWLNVIEDRPASAVNAYIECNEGFFPNLKGLLRVLATGTLPVSSATPDKSFSTLKRIKSYNYYKKYNFQC